MSHRLDTVSGLVGVLDLGVEAEPEAWQLFARRRVAKFAERSESDRRLTQQQRT